MVMLSLNARPTEVYKGGFIHNNVTWLFMILCAGQTNIYPYEIPKRDGNPDPREEGFMNCKDLSFAYSKIEKFMLPFQEGDLTMGDLVKMPGNKLHRGGYSPIDRMFLFCTYNW